MSRESSGFAHRVFIGHSAIIKLLTVRVVVYIASYIELLSLKALKVYCVGAAAWAIHLLTL